MRRPTIAAATSDQWLPQVISSYCLLTPRGSAFDDHVHAFDEICLVANHPSWIRHAGRERLVKPGTVFLHRRGEHHGYRNELGQEPHLWLIHFLPDEALYREFPNLASDDPERRVWQLSREQQAGYQGLFVRLQAELALHRPGAQAAASAWLRLLLISAARWDEPLAAIASMPSQDPQLMSLWEVIHDHIDRPVDFTSALKRRVTNYDSLRHRFRKVYGVSPRDFVLRLRMDRAKHLLLESDMSVTAVAKALGYGRIHEFIRVFRSRVGRTPTAFRASPDRI
ncbi:MAG: AraC family transcriptional regulator [Planctomycetota bacterium]